MASGRVTLVFYLLILAIVIDNTQSASCCLNFAKRHLRNCDKMLGYTIQTNHRSCDVNAVIFHLPGRFLCADPSSNYAQRIMKCFDERKNPAGRIVKGKN